jgi:cyanophycinase
MIPQGKLIIIGGAVDIGSAPDGSRLEPSTELHLRFFEKGILRRLINESSKQEKSRVEIITTASIIPHEVAAQYTQAFNYLGVDNVGNLDISKREDANNETNLNRVKEADVVIFTGGDQLRISSIIGGTEFHELLLNRYQQDNFMVAGTSAGAAAASNNMIYEGSSSEALLKGKVKITSGLGFINDVIIDTHFVHRGRIGRLIQAVASNPRTLGIGLGEDTGLLIRQGTDMEAIGSGLVILVDGRKIRDTNITEVQIGEPISIEHIVVHVMAKHDHYSLGTRTLTIHKPVVTTSPDEQT